MKKARHSEEQIIGVGNPGERERLSGMMPNGMPGMIPNSVPG
jgi:hypothetical protein